MDNENKFWLGFFSLVALVIMVLMSSVLGYHKDTNAKILKAETCAQATLIAGRSSLLATCSLLKENQNAIN